MTALAIFDALLADEVAAELSIRTNRDGLIATFEEVAAVRSWMLSRPPAQAPAPMPWCVVGPARVTLR
ncbi:hypothetical protein [Actinotalea subterranea]|uniref:hypothetical protein n=1 Tax=Actinotalea subterranea TaxID=2607497 RepID=UPI0011ED126E|nr:hypothetical protein [Actinotalea subterranea]